MFLVFGTIQKETTAYTRGYTQTHTNGDALLDVLSEICHTLLLRMMSVNANDILVQTGEEFEETDLMKPIKCRPS